MLEDLPKRLEIQIDTKLAENNKEIKNTRHPSKTSINMADGGKFGGKRRRELKEEKKYIYIKLC